MLDFMSNFGLNIMLNLVLRFVFDAGLLKTSIKHCRHGRVFMGVKAHQDLLARTFFNG